MDRIQNFCSDITIDIAFESDTSESSKRNENRRLDELGIGAKVKSVKDIIKVAKKSMENHDFKTAKRDLMQVKQDITNIRSTVKSIEPDSNESKRLGKICSGLANAMLILTGAFIGGVIGRNRSNTAYNQSKKDMLNRLSVDEFCEPFVDKMTDAEKTVYDHAKGNLEWVDPKKYGISKLGMAAGAGISAAPAISLYKLMDKHIDHKAHFIKALDLCEASVNELISNCDAAEKKVSE